MKLVLIVLVSVGLFFSLPWKSGRPDPFAEREKFVRVAREFNPIFTALKPTAQTILAGSTNDAAIAAACFSKDEVLARILHPENPFPRTRRARPLDLDVKMMLHPAERFRCRADSISRDGLRPCAEWCVESWKDIADIVDGLRADAEVWGVRIVPLR